LSDDRMPHLIITDPLMMGDLSGHEPKISLEIKKTDPLWTCSYCISYSLILKLLVHDLLQDRL
jgi:hypothetical protein